MKEAREGYVYALYSDACRFIKIGRTRTSPAQRLRELNVDPIYRPLGPWRELSTRKVLDCFGTETILHRSLDRLRVREVDQARELFDLSRSEALGLLADIPASELAEPIPLMGHPADRSLVELLLRLFETVSLDTWLDEQGAWVLTFNPVTSGGRHFTLSIGTHEVAFRTLGTASQGGAPLPMVMVDRLIQRDREIRRWLRANGGRIGWSVPYRTARPFATCLYLDGPLESALGLFERPGFRRALVAYWVDALLEMRAKGTRSPFARHHNYAAAAEIVQIQRQRRDFRLGRL